MKDTLTYIISAIVDDPEAVQITEEETDGITHYSVTVAKGDMGKVIGREGKVIRSIRNIMKIKAMKQGARISIALADTDKDAASETVALE